MSAPLSVIIPTLNAADHIGGCLSALVSASANGLIKEVIVSDGGSDDETARFAKDMGATWLSGESGRGAQLAAGANAANGDWLLFLHADTWLSEGWQDDVWRHIESSADTAATFQLAYRSDAKNARWLERRANWRARTLGLPYGDQGLLISRRLYDEVGGFQDVPLMEDVVIVRAIGKDRLSFLPSIARTCPKKYEKDGWRKRGWRNAVLTIRFMTGASPDKLAKLYK